MPCAPSSSSASSGLFSAGWSSGDYVYDGAGNVTRMGLAWFTYDKVSRLTEGRVYLGPYGGGVQKSQTYTFDPFGNITAIGGTSGRSTPTSASTNRLTGTGTAYDAAGNLTNWNGAAYQYDRFNQMTRMTNGGEDWFYLYTADGIGYSFLLLVGGAGYFDEKMAQIESWAVPERDPAGSSGKVQNCTAAVCNTLQAGAF